jgi:hypothetical protein
MEITAGAGKLISDTFPDFILQEMAREEIRTGDIGSLDGWMMY